ncbi:helix-turn-helix domain-containing protein [Propionibacteriaceae bacterium Y1923]|uniref:helix-turn-helix domain-containing protein n=1 Tax=Aestuariimicrobium sp. Y1814 TaxID=3418742 RepID=UPI003C26C8CB
MTTTPTTTEPFCAALGRVIADRRLAAGLTRHQLAEQLGTTEERLASVEAGDMVGFFLPDMVDLARALGSDIVAIVREAEALTA